MPIQIPRVAFLFPGQGSQILGMGKELAQSFPVARRTYEQADDLLGFSLSDLCWNGPNETLDDTINTQPALLVHSIATWRVLMEQYPDFKPVFIAGHSMGEISALVGAGALDFNSALTLARRRGELMKKAGEINPGGMAAILGLDIATLEAVCQQASTTEEIVQVANDNCPGQVVISGSTPALERAINLAQAAGARRAVKLAVSIAAHSPLMLNAQSEFTVAVTQANLNDPLIPVIGNVGAIPLWTSDEVHSDLQAQLTSRVRWTESIQYLLMHEVTHFIEIGSGNVLTGLLKRIDRQASGLSLGTPADLAAMSAWIEVNALNR